MWTYSVLSRSPSVTAEADTFALGPLGHARNVSADGKLNLAFWISSPYLFCYMIIIILMSLSLSVLTVIFQVNLGWPVFIEAKDDGGGDDN